jgi:hypothetical protein
MRYEERREREVQVWVEDGLNWHWQWTSGRVAVWKPSLGGQRGSWGRAKGDDWRENDGWMGRANGRGWTGPAATPAAAQCVSIVQELAG